MFVVYREHIDDLDWYFHTQCPRWPETNFVQVRFVEVSDTERLCAECIRLQLKMFPPKD
jgi:hypothetical protein